MNCIITKSMTTEDIPTWIALSNEYDDYVRGIVPDLTQWYEGNESDMAFADYMKAKIEQGEAIKAIEKNTNKCLGIVAFSKKHNRITFFGIYHSEDFFLTGEILMNCVFSYLNNNREITINVLKSKEKHINKHRELYNKYEFIYGSNVLENGVPVDRLIKLPS